MPLDGKVLLFSNFRRSIDGRVILGCNNLIFLMTSDIDLDVIGLF